MQFLVTVRMSFAILNRQAADGTARRETNAKMFRQMRVFQSQLKTEEMYKNFV